MKKIEEKLDDKPIEEKNSEVKTETEIKQKNKVEHNNNINVIKPTDIAKEIAISENKKEATMPIKQKAIETNSTVIPTKIDITPKEPTPIVEKPAEIKQHLPGQIINIDKVNTNVPVINPDTITKQFLVQPIISKDNIVKSQNVVSTVPNVQTTPIPQQQTVKPQNTKQSVIPNIQTQPQKVQHPTVQSIQQQINKPIVSKDNMIKSQNVVSTVPNVQPTPIPQQQTEKLQNIVKPIAPPLQPQNIQQQTQSITKTVIPNIQTQQPIVNNHPTIVTPSAPITPVQQPIILKNVQPVTSQTSQIQKETKK